jgi:flagellar biosynthesis/type III secretory pathway chaperone
MDNLQEHLTILKDVLVKEFRACQALHELSKKERLVLTSKDTCDLLILIEHKEAVLDEMRQLENKRRKVISHLSQGIGLQTKSPTLTEVLDEIDNEYCDRLKRLHEGIVALSSSIRNITYSNRAQAKEGLERVETVKSFLFDLFQPFSN